MLTKIIFVVVNVFAISALLAQSANPPALFTAAQAEAGRKAFQEKGGATGNKDTSCADCHTPHLTGRTGAPDEVPPISSFEPAMQKSIQSMGRIPALAGPKFVAIWGARTTQALTNRIKIATGPDETEETFVNLTAYILQVNGAKPGTKPLTAATSVEIQSVIATPKP
jgi:hypothetical protein